MNQILTFIKKIIPQPLFRKMQPVYHLVLNWLAAVWYGFPSNKLVVVGVTGTTGKTTTVFLMAELLRSVGWKVGYTSTAMFSDGRRDWLNDKKMTMVGRFFTQKMLRRMVKNGCQIAIVETTSEGVAQNRHRFINYDLALFTGLYPEHLESHGGFENYKQAKLRLFKHLERCPRKNLPLAIANLKNVKKTIIVNLDDEHVEEFLDFKVEKKIGFADKDKQGKVIENKLKTDQNLEVVWYKFLGANRQGVRFLFADTEVQLKILGKFNALNATAAGCVGRALGLNNQEIKKGLERVKNLPGRLERIEEGQNFTVIVDYAFEPVAVSRLYETVEILQPKKIIHILGSAGGGRDRWRRPKLGQIAGQRADYVVITNEDPYDEDPAEIMAAVASGAKKAGKEKEKNLFLIADRRQAIEKAISLAKEGDLVLITGKGSEQAIALANGRLLPWDDREVTREVLKKTKLGVR